ALILGIRGSRRPLSTRWTGCTRQAWARLDRVAALVSKIEIDRPPDEVFAYVTDPSRFVTWQDNIVSGCLEGDGPPRVGSKCTTTRGCARYSRCVPQREQDRAAGSASGSTSPTDEFRPPGESIYRVKHLARYHGSVGHRKAVKAGPEINERMP